MSKKPIRNQLFTLSSFGIIALGTGACLAGSLVSHFGGLMLSLALTAAIGFLCLLFILVFSKTPKKISKPLYSSMETTHGSAKDEEIPSDRIDPLTGLANENGLMAWFSDKAARLAADGKGIIILSADLDNFAQVERTYGKESSNAVLIEVAKRVASCTGTDGIAARTSNDEFAAIATVVPLQSREIAAEQAGKLAELIQRPVELPSGVIWIGGFVGAAYGSPLEGLEVLSHARDALMQAKLQGRGHYKVYSPDK